MSSTHAGDPTEGISPSPTPAPDSVPVVQIPSDGDPANAASILQSFKQWSDDIAWLKDPRATAGSLTQLVAKWRNARLQRRYVLDHRGFPGGQIQSWIEDWTTSFTDTTSTTGTNVIYGSRWLFTNTVGGGGEIAAIAPNPTVTLVPVTLYPALSLHVVTTSPVSRAVFSPRAIIAVTDDIDAVASFIVLASGASGDLAVNEIGAGFIDSAVTTNVQFSANSGQGAWFGKRTSDTNWQAFTRVSVGGALAAVDTGILADATQRRMRIEIQGPNASDDGSRRVIFHIDGSVVANVVVNWATPTVPSLRLGFSSVRTGAGAGGAWNIIVGPVGFRANLLPGDVF